MKKHFQLEITDTASPTRASRPRSTKRQPSTASTCCAPTSPTATLAAADVVRSYKQLAQAERAFRTLKGPELADPPHPPPPRRPRPRARLPLHARLLPRLAPPPSLEAAALRRRTATAHQPDPVAKAERSPHAERKAAAKRTTNGEPCHSFTSLLAELATLTRNTIRLPQSGATFDQLTEPTHTQTRALALIDSHTPTT